MSTVEELTTLINQKGDEIRNLKASNGSKEAVMALVAELQALKEKFKEANGGVPFDPPKAEPVKKPKAEPQPEPVRDGPSKKELNKLARKERTANYKEAHKSDSSKSDAPESSEVPSVATSAPVPAPIGVSIPNPTPVAILEPSESFSATITYSKTQIPELTRTIVAVVNAEVSFSPSTNSEEHLPYLTINPINGSLSGDVCISKYFLRSTNAKGAALYGGNDAFLSSQVDEWLNFYSDLKSNKSTGADESTLDFLNSHLETRTFLVGYSLSAADIANYLYLKKADFNPSTQSTKYPNVSRWFNLIGPQLPFPRPLTQKKAPATKPTVSTQASTSASAAPTAADANTSGEEGTCPPLEDAVDGQVCTRFPPEPSGYLHIGHCKAVLLNQYYAQRYHGKLIVRFDDTNPSKEKEEYEENIIKDLETLNVKADLVSHTSDHFDLCVKLAKQLIQDGLGYMDDTDQEVMQKERMELKESKHRNSSVEENLKIFELLLQGDASAVKYCLRAKIDMQSVNGTMRDPVMYRFNDTPHHRTGTKHKAYPTYDFACPIVDAVEGVTHALRTTEYNDRDEQYHWIQRALRLRDVKIMTYGKVNFVNTVLSKRKLNWFVEQGLVEGWFDPRFPTIQGCIRRGMNVDALKHFILSQGASRRVITMEWDKFWSENKRVLEETCPRYMAVNTKDAARVLLENIPEGNIGHTVQIHPQKPELGTRVMRRSNKLLLDQADAKTIRAGEEVTLLRWGNIKVRAIDSNSDGLVTTIYASYDPEATNFSKTKKLTWLADVEDVVPITMVEFDHLISKAKLGDDEDFKDFVNPSSRFEYAGVADPLVRSLVSGTVVQLERKGFYRVDKAYGGEGRPAVLFAIPDGKAQKK